jgi:acyl-CoA synthetase (AMP-forming)/AMP-acid ligase II
VIICGGFNVVPEELEAALMTDPAVREAAVLGVRDERLGEVPVAVVVADATGDEILARVNPIVAPYKRPRRVVVVGALPRVPNGKIDLRACAALVTRPD